VAVACDILWYYRNKAFHDGISFDALSVLKHINKISLKHFQACHPSSQIQEEKWTPPIQWVKINFNMTTWDSLSAQAAVCHDEKGLIIHATSQISNSCSPNEGEAMAASQAISLAICLHLDHFIIEGDSVVVVHALQNLKFVRD
jgi:hypothetical protein